MADTGFKDVSWRAAGQATLHCLTGCAIGEVAGMVIATALNLPNIWQILLAILLAFACGYTLTMRGVMRHGLGFRQALRVALTADTLSIIVMEITDNSVDAAIPGALNAPLDTWLFWGSLLIALVVAFLVATPVNRLLISRGMGHAVVHQHHAHD